MHRREWEAEFNYIPQYTIEVKDDEHTYTIHFTRLFFTNPLAIPIVFLHELPGLIFEFLPLLLDFRSKHLTLDVLSYYLTVPHLVGFEYYSPPQLDEDFNWNDNVRIISKMVHLLGFEMTGYVAQGGDLGSAVASAIAAYDSACRLVHLNMFIMPPPAGIDLEAGITQGQYQEEEVRALKAANGTRTVGYAYA